MESPTRRLGEGREEKAITPTRLRPQGELLSLQLFVVHCGSPTSGTSLTENGKRYSMSVSREGRALVWPFLSPSCTTENRNV